MRGALVVLAVVLSGCAGSGPDAPATERAAPPPIADPGPENITRHPIVRVVPLELNGTLAPGEEHCVFDAPSPCGGHFVGNDRRELLLKGLVGNVTAAKVTLWWNASSPATQQLGMGLMTMGPPACECTRMLARGVGASPLTIEATATAPLPEGASLHLYVYETSEEANDKAYVYAQAPQDVHALGGATVLGTA